MLIKILTYVLAFVAGCIVGVVLMCVLVAGGEDDERWGD